MKAIKRIETGLTCEICLEGGGSEREREILITRDKKLSPRPTTHSSYVNPELRPSASYFQFALKQTEMSRDIL